MRRGQSSVQGEFDGVLQTRTGRICELAEWYATPLPRLADEVVALAALAALAARVEGHLVKMGAAWK